MIGFTAIFFTELNFVASFGTNNILVVLYYNNIFSGLILQQYFSGLIYNYQDDPISFLDVINFISQVLDVIIF